MDREIFDGWRTLEAAPLTGAPRADGRDEDWEHVRLACRCGGDGFRIVGWPRAASAVGGVFRRSFTRVFREVRAAMQPPESAESPFRLPLFVACDRCGDERALLDRESVPGRIANEHRHLPRESLRCRVCRRGRFAVDVSLAGLATSAGGRGSAEGAAVEVRAHCRACHHTTRIAWADERPSEQALRLDLLYGRR